ncbi:MAG: hypothetical protein HY053_06485, partial [Proteobacteria bacterium]|nr:hypothetical protein [Pseudomonadota bacterium]
MEWKSILGAVAFLGAVVGFVPYVYSIYKNKTKPHLFTWLVWAILTSMIFGIQFTQGAGPGAWHMGITALTSIAIMGLSFFYGEKKGSKLDWAAFLLSLAAIPLWLVAKDPASAAVLLTLIDVMAFWPTISKTWRKPYQENLFYYGIWLVRYPLATLAVQNMNVANLVYPATWSV